MKFTATLSYVLVALAATAAAAGDKSRQSGGFGGFGGANANNNKGGAGAGAAASSAAVSSVAAAASSAAVSNTDTAAAASSASATDAAGASSDSGDEQDSLTLDPSVIATGFEQDGQATPTAGQVASLTSKNNFINFCLTSNLPITNGLQIQGGSCNPAPMGIIASTSNMPSGKFQNPPNGATIAANTEFTVEMAISNLEAGNFVNADTNYYSAPQQVNAQGDIIGHSHVVIESLTSLDQTTPTNPKNFAFFKGINGAAVNGVITADVTDGLPAGFYRVASINAAANHQPVLVAIAQHGSLDDMVYITVSDNGAASNSTAAAGAASTDAAASVAATDAASSAAATVAASTAAAAASSTAAAAGGKGAAAGAGAGAAAGKGAAQGNANGKASGKFGFRFARDLSH